MRFSFLSRWAAALIACVTALVVAACGSGASSSTSSPASAAGATAPASGSTTAASATTTTTSTSTVTSTSTSSGAPATAASSPSGCTHADTAVSLHTMGAATGHAGLLLVFRNSGSAACTLTGYPGVNLVTAHGHQVQVPRTPQGFMGGLSPQAKVDPVAHLAPGQQAAAVLEGNDFNPKTSGACPHYSMLLVTPPNQTQPFSFSRPLALCNPQIHPVVPGRTGRQGS